MNWFMFVVFVHISQYSLENPTDVKFIQIDKQYEYMDECINDQPTQTIKQIKKQNSSLEKFDLVALLYRTYI